MVMESIQELLRKLCKCIVKSDDDLNYITISKQETPTPDIVITAFKDDTYSASNVASNAFSDFLLNASENGRLFIPWKLQSAIKCPDTWERYTL